MTNFFLSILLIFLQQIAFNCIPSPPTILRQADKEIIFDPRINIEIPCVSKGDPAPKYTWTKDKRIYDPSAQNNRVAMKSNSGTLIITSPSSADQGWYQCNATNQYGTALSFATRLRMAELSQFPYSSRSKIVRARRGDWVILDCTPPTGVPDPYIYWSVVGDNDRDQFGTITVSARVTQDYYGKLYILNVEDEDEKDKRPYACNAYSRRLLLLNQGELTVLEVEKVSPTNKAPVRLWSSEQNKVFLLNSEMRLKCIFGGRPTPQVTWRKIDGILPTDGRYLTDSEGQELVIRNVKFSDKGTYECRGSNELGMSLASINVVVESEPYWIEKPEDQNVGIGEDVTFVCDADGTPAPNKVDWYVNGEPIQSDFLKTNKRISINNKFMEIQNVELTDTSVFACNVTNKHGYAWSNFYLNVLAEPPEIQEPPANETKVVEGEPVEIKCLTFGAPRPQIVWRRNYQLVTGGRFTIRPDATLYLSASTVADSGVYECIATNRYGNASAKGMLSVKQKTLLQTKPDNQEMRVGSYVTFRCTAKTDIGLTHTIDWLKDGHPISYAGRFIKDPLDQNTLKITDLQFEDGGTYTCVARTDVDEVRADATLVVQDRPNRPRIDAVSCTSGSSKNGITPKVKIDFSSGGENNAKILYYIIQYNTTFTPTEWNNVLVHAQREISASVENKTDDEITKLTLVRKFEIYQTDKIPGTQSDLTFNLTCWANYTFRVKAVNRLGDSEPSEISSIPCQTNPCRPSRHPIGVRGFGNASNNLIITWNPMPKIDWNAPIFWYQVEYRELKRVNSTTLIAASAWNRVRATNDDSYVLVRNTPSYTPYEFYVKAYNQQVGDGVSGEATEIATLYRGFSGEDKPAIIPSGFKRIDQTNANTAKFAWDPITLDQAEVSGGGMRGRLAGFIIMYQKTSGAVAGQAGEVMYHKVDGNQTSTTISKLPAYSTVRLQIAALNDRYQGDFSAPIAIATPDGVPGPVVNLRGRPYGSSGVKLEWEEPEEPNGVITGYEIHYQKMENIYQPPGLLQPPIIIKSRSETSKIVTGLVANQKYRFTVLAVTSKGASNDPNLVEVVTSSARQPSKTNFQVLSTFEDGFNITWSTLDQMNAASLFYVKYRKADEVKPPWYRTALSTDNTIFVGDLDSGTKYDVVLVSTTGTGETSLETESDIVILKTLGTARAVRNIATEPWFIGLMVAISILLIIVINVCVLVRERGGKYSVHEKEPFNEHQGGDDQGFDEYQKPDDDYSRPPGPGAFDDGRFHDEDDSIAEYGNGENGKFNEDGSFIGLYGRDRVQTYIVQHNNNQSNNNNNGNASQNQANTSTNDPSKPYSTFV